MFKKIFSLIIASLMLFSFVSAASAYSSTIYCPSYATSDYCTIDKVKLNETTVNGADITTPGRLIYSLDMHCFDLYTTADNFLESRLTNNKLENFEIKTSNSNEGRMMVLNCPDGMNCSIRLHFEFDGRGEFWVTIPNFVDANKNSEYCLDHEWKACKRDRVYIDSHFGYYGQQHVYDNYEDSTLHRD